MLLLIQAYTTTVESPNNGHNGDMAFVCCIELSASQRLLTITYVYYMVDSFHSTSLSVVRFSECPFWETPLYIVSRLGVYYPEGCLNYIYACYRKGECQSSPQVANEWRRAGRSSRDNAVQH